MPETQVEQSVYLVDRQNGPEEGGSRPIAF
jgi:hypothetical protein